MIVHSAKEICRTSRSPSALRVKQEQELATVNLGTEASLQSLIAATMKHQQGVSVRHANRLLSHHQRRATRPEHPATLEGSSPRSRVA